MTINILIGNFTFLFTFYFITIQIVNEQCHPHGYFMSKLSKPEKGKALIQRSHKIRLFL